MAFLPRFAHFVVVVLRICSVISASLPNMHDNSATEESKLSESDLRELYLHYGDAGVRLDSNAKREGRELCKLVEVAKAVLWHKAKAVIAESAGRPVLYSYSSDSTPVVTKRKYFTHFGYWRKCHEVRGNRD